MRFYEREGLFASPVERTADGRRAYCERDVAWLDQCVKLRSSGMPLAATRRYAEMVREGPGNERERLDILRVHQQRVTAQIAALTTCLQMINFKVNLYQDSLTADSTDPTRSPSVGSWDGMAANPLVREPLLNLRRGARQLQHVISELGTHRALPPAAAQPVTDRLNGPGGTE